MKCIKIKKYGTVLRVPNREAEHAVKEGVTDKDGSKLQVHYTTKNVWRRTGKRYLEGFTPKAKNRHRTTSP